LEAPDRQAVGVDDRPLPPFQLPQVRRSLRELAPALGLVRRGGNFMNRLWQLADARDQAEQALAALRLGKGVQDAVTDAEPKQVDAVAKLAEA
jgi:hypothetical protein